MKYEASFDNLSLNCSHLVYLYLLYKHLYMQHLTVFLIDLSLLCFSSTIFLLRVDWYFFGCHFPTSLEVVYF